MQKHEDNLTSQLDGGALVPLSGVTVSVTSDATGLAASLYSDNGVTPITSDIISDDLGYYSFHAPNGEYTLTFSSPRIKTFTRKLILADPSDNPYATLSQLAAPSGASNVGNGTETVADSLNALQLADYAALRAYTGPRKSVYVTGYLGTAAPSGIAGMFVRDDSDTTTADDGINVIVAANDVRWKRSYDSALIRSLAGDGSAASVSAIAFSGTGANDAAVTGSYAGAFPISIAARVTNPATAAVATTGFSASGGIGTLLFAGGATYPVGSWVEIAGVSVSSGSINGRQYVLTSAPGQITFYTSATGSQTAAGTVQDFDEFEMSFDGGTTYQQTYQTYDPVTDNDKSVAYTCNTYAAQLDTVSDPTRIFGFAGLFISWTTSRGHSAGAKWWFVLNPSGWRLYTPGSSAFLNGARALTVDQANRSVGIGSAVFGALTSIGVENIGIGFNALNANTTGYANTGIGADALSSNTAGGANVAIAPSALISNTRGNDNIAIGLYAKYKNTTGSNNVAVGVDAHRWDQTGSGNVAIGEQALYSVEGGTQNTAVGLYALRGGESSLEAAVSNTYCTAIGSNAGKKMANTTRNTAVGFEALYQCGGNYNTAVGVDAGFSDTAGTNNTYIGYNAGSNASQTGNLTNTTVIGAGAWSNQSNSVVLGNTDVLNTYVCGNVSNQFDNYFSLGQSFARWTVVYAATGTINTSDANAKQQIRPISDAETAVAKRIKSLIRAYKFNDAVEKKGDAARWHFGVIAQEVKAAFEAEGLDPFVYGLLCYDEWPDEFDAAGNMTVKAGSRYGVRYEELLIFMIAAL